MACAAGPDINENGLVLALDAANKKSYSQNEFQYSTDIFAWCGPNHNACNVSRDTISSPVGNTPLKMEVVGNDPHLGTYNSGVWNIAPAANGQTWVVSVYVKATVATTGQIFIFGANSAGTGFVGGAWLAITAVTFNITTEWTRVSHYVTMANADIAYIHARLDGPDSGGTGQIIWWDGLQVERVPSGTSPTPFTSSYYGGSVYRDLVGSNNGTLVNYPTYSSSNGGSLSFDGVDDYVETALFTPNITSKTYCCWTKLNSTTQQGGGLIGLMSSDGNTFDTIVYNETNQGWGFGSEFFNRTAWSNIKETSTNDWVYICATYSNNDYRLYRNGIQILQTTSFSLLNFNFSSKAILGKRHSVSTGPLNAYIANASIYNRALTASEIQQNYNALKGRFGL